ncbi:MAG TPA: hypothetical protein VF756_22265 [Thermoanaerobaculia bacterium]
MMAMEEPRAEAAVLLERLMETPVGRRHRLLDKPELQRFDLVELLLEESHRLQLPDPGRAEELAALAAILSERVRNPVEPARSAHARALCLEGNACRLQGELERADSPLSYAHFFVETVADRAVYSRTVGLLRWEQGRLDEALALLRHAGRLFAEDQLGLEHGVCLLLLGLACSEWEGPAAAVKPLLHGWATMEPAAYPWLSMRAGLTLSGCLAEEGQAEAARATLGDAVRLYPRLREPGEVLRAFRLEARAKARLGRLDEAENLLEGLRRKLLEERSDLPELALASLELGFVLAATGRRQRIEALAREIEERFEPEDGRDMAAGTLRGLEGTLAEGHSPAVSVWSWTSDLLRLLRFHDVRIEPLPFA